MDITYNPKKLSAHTLKRHLKQYSLWEQKLAEDITCLEIKLAYRKEQQQSLNSQIDLVQSELLGRNSTKKG